MLKRHTAIVIGIIGAGIAFRLIAPQTFSHIQERVKSVVISATKEFTAVPPTVPQLLESSTHTSERAVAHISDSIAFTTADIINETNKERVKNHLPPLIENTKLDASAAIKVNDMIRNQYFEHTSPNGKSVSDLGKQVGYQYIVLGENLALGNFATASELVNAWMNSPGHRANILSKNYDDIGVFAATGTFEGRTVVFAVQHFGTQKMVCPQIDGTLRSEINTITVDLATRDKYIASLKEKILAETQGDSTYENDITQFNVLVDTYNQIIAVQKQKIAVYNQQVNAFNNCLSRYQTATH